ncbi:MAG: hypothetical protein ACLGSD_13285 [Acidobacteriota bacterium]
MKVRPILEVVIATIGFALIGLIAWNEWTVFHMYHPGAENQSAFLRFYDPKPIVQKFMAPNKSYSESRSLGGAAGTKSVRHNASFGEFFPMRTECKSALIAALSDDTVRQLRQSGVRIVGRNGTSSTGIRFDYRTANTLGSVSIKPLKQGRVVRNRPLCPGLEDVVVEVAINEEWFPKGVPLPAATVADNMRQAPGGGTGAPETR